MARRHDISGDWCRIETCYPLIYNRCIHFNKFLLSVPCPDSEHNVTIVDKRIEDADNGIPVHQVLYRIEYGVLRYIHSETVYYRCEVGKRYHMLIQCDGLEKLE